MLFHRVGFGTQLEQVILNTRWVVEVERDQDQLQGYATHVTGRTYEMGIDTEGRRFTDADFDIPVRVQRMLVKLLKKHWTL